MFKKLKEFLQTTQMDVKEVKPPEPSVPITGVLMDDLVYLRTQFGVSADLTIRRLNICGHEAAVVTLEGMIDRHMMADDDDGLASFRIVTDGVASFPATILSFADVALAVCSSLWHGISPFRQRTIP